MLRIGKLSWKFIGCFVIFLILSVNVVSAANNQTNNDTTPNSDNRNNNMSSDSRTNNNVTNKNCSDDLTTYNYSGVYIDLPKDIPTPLKIDDNWAGDYILIDEFLFDVCGIKWNPPSVRTRHWYNFCSWLCDVIVYGLYAIWFGIQVVLGTLAWVVYNLGWLIISFAWSFYWLIMQILLMFNMESLSDTMTKLENSTSYYKYFNGVRTVTDPEKIMSNFKANVSSHLNSSNNSIDGLLFALVNPLSINPYINDSRNVTIKKINSVTNNSSNETNNVNIVNMDNNTVVYSHESVVGVDIPDENGNINCTNVTNSTNCINSHNLVNCNNVANSIYIFNSSDVANSSNVFDSKDITNSSDINYSDNILGGFNVTNCSIVSNSTSIISSSNILSSSNVTNCFNVINSFDVLNSNNSISSRDVINSSDVAKSFSVDSSFNITNSGKLLNSDNLINCSVVFNSSNCVGCNDSSFLVDCVFNRNATNCSNCSYVFDMANRSNEFRQTNGYLHVLSTEHVKMSNGALNPCKVKINGTIPDEAKGTIVDNDGYVSFFTLTDQDLINYNNNLTEQIKTLNKSIENLKENQEECKTAMIVMGTVLIISIIVAIVAAFISNGQSTHMAEKEAENDAQGRIEVEGHKRFISGNRVVSRELLSICRLSGPVGKEICSYSLTATGIFEGSKWIAAAALLNLVGIAVGHHLTATDMNEEELVCSFDDGVLSGVVMEMAFRADNKIIVDPIIK
ncbi:MAG: hypothetical protein LBR15_07825 [Methanobrevibacter sp.]|jgi:hypothetical protein|nr:hypothetical protein [Candidatus Methanovirga australis]